MNRILFFLTLLLCVALSACNRHERAPKPEPVISEAHIHAKLEELEARAVKLQIKMALAAQLTPPASRDALHASLALNRKNE